MPSCRWLIAAFVVASTACGSSGPSEQTSPVTGHFVATDPWPNGPGFVLSVSLSGASDTVSGSGWLGGLDNPLTLLSVQGHVNGPDVTLTITAQDGDPSGTLVGTLTGSGIQGTYTMAPGSTPVSITLRRVDTAATGRYTSSLTGAASEQPSAAAGFGVVPNSFVIILAYPGRNFPLLTLSRLGTRPHAGTYPFGGASGFVGTVVPAYAPDQRFYSVTSGSVNIDVSTPFDLIGRVTLQAKDSTTGATLNMTASFSAGCSTEVCH